MSLSSPRPILLVALVAALVFAASGKSLNLANTIVRQRINWKMASNCTYIRIPPKMCTSCRMRPFDSNGNFPNQRDIYDLKTPGCRSALQEYARINPCDTPRVQQISKWIFAADTQWRIAEFMYNICETCCDCIPFGSQLNQYDQRKEKGNLFFIKRGNCPVHVWYDTCRMWPKVKWVGGYGAPPASVEKRTPVCDAIRPWFNSPKSNGWLKNPSATIDDPVMVDFLWRFVFTLQCKDRTVWNECVNLELAQGRLGNKDEL